MRYIDKHQHLQAGHAITDDYLDQECRINDGNGHYCYQNVDYEGSFGSSGAKSKMQQLALNSQENYCCYCMRDLHMQNQQVTLEHIIPQSCSVAELANYTQLNVSPLTDDEVVLTSSFTQVTDIHVPPRPHTVTFENLTASCDGTFPDKEGTSQCCNHHRGCKFVYPMFFEVDVEEKIVYRENGAMQPKNGCPHSDEYRKTIENVRLNCQNLMDIRRLWHLFANVDQNELVACLNDRNLRMKSLRQVLYQDNAISSRTVFWTQLGTSLAFTMLLSWKIAFMRLSNLLLRIFVSRFAMNKRSLRMAFCLSNSLILSSAFMLHQILQQE